MLSYAAVGYRNVHFWSRKAIVPTPGRRIKAKKLCNAGPVKVGNDARFLTNRMASEDLLLADQLLLPAWPGSA